jgi:CHAT domain-containing protein
MKLEGDEISATEFAERMENFSIVHLACHGIQEPSQPLKSRFLFHQGKLDLTTIMQRDLKNADLAFLSACQTGTGEKTLSDEAVHLAAGMLAAGYRRVVATMWGIKDKYAPKVADDFYEYLLTHRTRDSGPQLDGSLSAHALHHAVQQLRDSVGNSDSSLLSWIPYVHFGY